jgi:hypothetical protein
MLGFLHWQSAAGAATADRILGIEGARAIPRKRAQRRTLRLRHAARAGIQQRDLR